jgi:hypothetical protein
MKLTSTVFTPQGTPSMGEGGLKVTASSFQPSKNMNSSAAEFIPGGGISTAAPSFTPSTASFYPGQQAQNYPTYQQL